MSARTTSKGTTVSLTSVPLLGTLVRLDHPGSPEDLRNTEVGRILQGHLQLPGSEFAMSPEVLRAIADLIEEHQNKEN